MGLLRHDRTERNVVLATDQVIGRQQSSDVVVTDSRASAQHARIRWDGEGWEIRDLGSRNGTWVNKKRLEAGPRMRLEPEMTVAFGDADDAWTLVDAEPPCAFLQPMDGRDAYVENGGVLMPPPDSGARVAIRRGRNGVWMLEDGDDTRPLRDRQLVTLGELRCVFRSDGRLMETKDNQNAPPRIEEISLRFGVSSDEEHVQISIVYPRGVINLPPRRSAYVLLTLARHRLADAERGGIPEGDQGWAYTDQLVKELAYETERRLNLDIFRLREQFTAARVEGAQEIVERRRATGQLRIGVRDLRIDTT